MNDLFAERIFNIPWAVLAGIAVAVAIAYAFVPTSYVGDGLRWFVLRWFHTIAWVFLAAAALVRSKAIGMPVEMAAPLAATGGLIYVVLMLTTLAGGK